MAALTYKNWTIDLVPGTTSYRGVAVLNGQPVQSPAYADTTQVMKWVDTQPAATLYTAPALPATPTLPIGYTGVPPPTTIPPTTDPYAAQQQQARDQQYQAALQRQAAQIAALQRAQQMTAVQPDASSVALPAAASVETPLWKRPAVLISAAVAIAAIGWFMTRKRRA